MKAATVKQIKDELKECSPTKLMEICLTLSKFKKENKELLTYLLFEAHNESGYIQEVKNEIDEQFEQINYRNYYFIKKSVRKVLRSTKKYIRYSKKKPTEIELLIYFCSKLKDMEPSYKRNTVLSNTFNRTIESVEKKLALLHEDLQFDFREELKELQG